RLHRPQAASGRKNADLAAGRRTGARTGASQTRCHSGGVVPSSGGRRRSLVASMDDVPRTGGVGSAAQKKSLHASEQDRPDVQALRQAFRRRVARIDPKRLVFVDESGANTAMTRSHARAPRGQRAVGALPHGHWKTMTLIGALRLKGPVTGVTVNGPTDTEVFRAFVTDALAPALHRGDVVVWDNLSSHRAAGLTRTLATRGARFLALPPYSPDLSP